MGIEAIGTKGFPAAEAEGAGKPKLDGLPADTGFAALLAMLTGAPLAPGAAVAGKTGPAPGQEVSLTSGQSPTEVRVPGSGIATDAAVPKLAPEAGQPAGAVTTGPSPWQEVLSASLGQAVVTDDPAAQAAHRMRPQMPTLPQTVPATDTAPQMSQNPTLPSVMQNLVDQHPPVSTEPLQPSSLTPEQAAQAPRIITNVSLDAVTQSLIPPSPPLFETEPTASVTNQAAPVGEGTAAQGIAQWQAEQTDAGTEQGYRGQADAEAAPSAVEPPGAESAPMAHLNSSPIPSDFRAESPQAESPQAIPNPVDVERLMEELTRSLPGTKDGRYSVTLRLHPEHLGEVRLELQVMGRDVQTLLQVASPEARQMLEAKGESLRQSLADAGLNLAGFQVATNHQGQQSRRQEAEQETHTHHNRRGRTRPTAAPSEPIIRPIGHRPAGARLDTLA